ncbi:MAG TPA: tripartite tricarboxylate transporter substrate binding protein [Burkholderiales bacterium]|nr:tripartite tricarboxylate transporter substrate binding protein [Burkholderiales bacterium]
MGVGLALLALLSAATPGLAAAAYPAKAIRIVVTYVPGGSTDVVARMLAQHLGEDLGQQIVVDNRGGAGGIIGTEIVAHAPPDGYTMLFGTSAGLSINPLLHKKLPYNVERDFAPVSLVVVNPQLLVAYPGLPANSIGELIKLARARPGQINYASPGVGSPNHMGMELFKSMAGVDLVHVPYKGGAPATTDLISGQVQLLFNSIPSVLPHIKSGRLKAIAIGSASRSPSVPDIPTISEAGVPGFEYVTWYGLFAPSRTSRAVVAHLSTAVRRVLNKPELDRQLRAQGSEPSPSTPRELTKFMHTEHARWERVVRTIALYPQSAQ